jgi:hypothetical protein
VHPEFGVYDFPAITSALFEDGGFNLIAHQRPKNTDVDAYVDTLESWVLRLVAAGVTPEHMTLIGFSRGAQLTGYASSRLRVLGFGTRKVIPKPRSSSCRSGDVPAGCAALERALTDHSLTLPSTRPDPRMGRLREAPCFAAVARHVYGAWRLFHPGIRPIGRTGLLG